MKTLIHERVEQARKGDNPTVIRHVPSGWVVLGDVQFLPGYCLLLADPVVEDLHVLTAAARTVFLGDMGLLGEALMEVTGACRINYQILGNLDAALHAHVCPRYAWESQELRVRPTCYYDKTQAPRFDPQRDRPLMDRIGAALERLYQRIEDTAR